jgi:hypothetical protein
MILIAASLPALNTSLKNTSLMDLHCFAYDTGAGEGISICKDVFVVIDETPEVKSSVTIQGPSVGTPICLGRGSLVYIFDVGHLKRGLIHPKGILASSSEGSPHFRLALAMQLKKRGVRYVGDKFEGILTVTTNGSAKDIEGSNDFKSLVKEMENGLASPLFDVTPFLKGIYKSSEDENFKYAECMQVTQ